ncbi:MAG: DNA-3-methyladenine glycosylase family protein [Thermoplasmatota archaeon]
MRFAGPFLLDANLRGGQAFRWRPNGKGFHGTVATYRVHVTPTTSGGLAVESDAPRGALANYFALDDRAYGKRLARLAADGPLAADIACWHGLRVLKQDPWEALAAFVTSANNNVLRIEGILERLAGTYGEPLGGDAHAFPTAERIARTRVDDLRRVGLGYRAPFLHAAASRVASGDLDLARLARSRFSKARDALLDVPGVGPKVADCVALFGLGHGEAFPVDRWVARAVARRFPETQVLKERELGAWARKKWREDAGLAQQFLFHSERMSARVLK